MIKFVLILISSAIFSSPVFAFISPEEESLFAQAVTDISDSSLRVQSLRCSLRSRICLARMEVGTSKGSCVIERVSGASDLFTQAINKKTGKAHLTLSPKSVESLNFCLAHLSH